MWTDRPCALQHSDLPANTNACVGWHRHTLSTNSADQLISGSTATVLGLIFITDSPQNLTLHRWRSSLPGHRCSCLEQSATACHFCAFSSRLCISAENPLLLCFLLRTVLNVQCLWNDFVIIRHSNWSFYLLTTAPQGQAVSMGYFVMDFDLS